MTPSVLCATLEVALNRSLRQEPEVLEECARLEGRVIGLRLTGPDWDFFIEFMPTGVRVLPQFERAADVSVSGAPALVLRIGLRAAAGETGLPQGLRVEGDPELLLRFQRLLARAGFDPEELLEPLIGGPAAHRVVQGLGQFFGWGRKTAGTLALDTAEYLREETRDLARREDVEEWMNQVDTLRDGVERLEARLRRLEAHA